MSISAVHSEAARQNGKLSHGPATAQGKARSAQNARKHSLLASTALLSCENQAEFDTIAEGFLQEYNPETPTESRYVREMIDAEFRLQRARAHAVSIQEARMRQIAETPAETTAQTPTRDTAAEAFRQLAEEGPSLGLLLRYENQFRRQFDKSLELLLDFRLRERTDKDKIMKAHAEAYVQFTKDLVDLPMPGPPVEPVQAEQAKSETVPQSQPAAGPPNAPKSNTISFPKEPTSPAPNPKQATQQTTKKETGPLFGHFFGNFGR